MVIEFNKAKNNKQIEKLILVLNRDFAKSRDSHKRKGKKMYISNC